MLRWCAPPSCNSSFTFLMIRKQEKERHKRKRNWDTECPSFLEERPLQSKRIGVRTVGTAASLSEAWLKCGEGFQGTSGSQSLTKKKATTTGKHLEFSPRPKKEAITYKSTAEFTDITWSSSGSDLSDEDKILSESQKDNGHGSRIDRICNRNILGPEDGASEDELQSIDWEINSDREDASGCNEGEDGEGAAEISDCASCASTHSLTSEEKLPELPEPTSTEILEYSSHSEKEDDSENVLFIDSESPHKCDVNVGLDTRQLMDTVINPRVKSPEPILCTPQKQTAKLSRTPEDSAKKRKLLRGGLAERLNGLQNRERSAISLWRHQCVSYQKTLSGRKSGILIVKILELHEECTMQVATCEQLAGPPSTAPCQGVAPAPGAYLKVLFSRETAGYLQGRPQDIIHIFPPWQKLIIPNGSCPVILNTYFCQKFVAKEDPETTQKVYCRDTPLPRRNITLAWRFRIKDVTDNSPEIQVLHSGLVTTSTSWTHGHEEAKQHLTIGTSSKDSLLDVVESQGAAPYSEVRVQVVVQRVYFLPGRDSTRGQQRSTSGHEDQPGTRVCLLVQDAYGIFGEVHLEGAVLRDRQLEGRSCSLAGMKVLQKATRGRTPGLFSLLDTLWPPVMPLKVSGHSQPCREVETPLPPPAFCYIFSARPSLEHIDIIEEDSVSKLYQPPVLHYLGEILQTDHLGARCSFYARVIYQRPQLKSLLLLEQREIWLLVTDISLQTKTRSGPHLPKTLPVCVAPSCVLCPEVLQALTVAAPHSVFFRDAVRDHGQIICVERTVLLLQKPLLCVASGADSCELTGPVELDELDSLTPVNSICSVQGTVVDVDESTAFSWPVCDQCGSGRLEQRLEDRGAFSCGDCSRVVTSPVLKRHLQVFLDCPARPQCSVKVKLLQSSISSLLRFAACEDGQRMVTPRSTEWYPPSRPAASRLSWSLPPLQCQAVGSR
ncbi:PREDICTED: DNA repair-scaffolding protein isoform X1 [Chinchilla lanigera]|uniref:DNA repair-scaffolding protein isoform X1 n=1 Tax=Chinchilla lanigera TaxID=34839 RepID=UPI0006962A0C|nr:PREDICTED: DNA repair-scaffolding protein isoform X1 [Chinchilla lanigera]